jgi:hypothetical protein
MARYGLWGHWMDAMPWIGESVNIVPAVTWYSPVPLAITGIRFKVGYDRFLERPLHFIIHNNHTFRRFIRYTVEKRHYITQEISA